MNENKRNKFNQAFTRLMVILGLGGVLMILYATPDANNEQYKQNKKLEKIGWVTTAAGIACAFGAAATEDKNKTR